MPVYLLTVHAYRSWREDHPRGYVQKDEGLQPSNPELARWRDAAAKFSPVRFIPAQQGTLHEVAKAVSQEREVSLHGMATCPTHAHQLLSFAAPVCTCAASRVCGRNCPARQHAEHLATRVKQEMGQRLAKDAGTCGRPWFSRGWDLTPVRNREHYDHLMQVYLPDHERTQGGLFRSYDHG